ncbi:MAG TPA: YggS family pyridoxal phosphate-dependent enzyme [Jatrophihabitantaceae bacterium]|jgi:pyridoxal phosphate enzyme (YggS family)|nr:YggS family pyridoxal phosphate-dependent enzyme [Jatrophihabitantaceae bacterium]
MDSVAPPPDDHRRVEVLGSLAALRARLVDAATSAGRDPHAVTLIAVTKSFPAADVAAVLGLGVCDLGESRDQEVRAKIAELGPTATAARWHFVGRLQTNKCRSIAGYAHAVHSVDRIEVADALAGAVARLDRPPLEVFVQLSLDGDPARGGVPADGVAALADRVATRDGLRLAGLMAVAPMGADPAVAFAALARESALLRRAHPGAVGISAGMSQDFELAVKSGATHVRVGSALLGRRRASVG